MKSVVGLWNTDCFTFTSTSR